MKKIKRAKNPDTPEYTNKYYLSNKDIMIEVLLSKAAGRINDKLINMLMVLTRKCAQRPCFASYPYKDDMISEALTNLCQNALKFNSEKFSNAFTFYTTCIHHSFYHYLNHEKRHRRIRDELLVELGENPSFNFTEETRNQEAGGTFKDELKELKNNIIDAKNRIVIEDERRLKNLELKLLGGELLVTADEIKPIIVPSTLLEFEE